MTHRSIHTPVLLALLLAGLAGGAMTRLETPVPGLVLASQVALVILLAGCIWKIGPRGQASRRVPAPPWRARWRLFASWRPDPDPGLHAMRRELRHIDRQLRLTVPPARPWPARARWRRGRQRLPAPRARQARLRRLRLPVPAVRFVAADSTGTRWIDDQQVRAALAAAIEDVVARVVPAPPALRALHDQPHQLICQVTAVPVLTGAQQRAVVRVFQEQGIQGRWSGETELYVQREGLQHALAPWLARWHVQRWLPVVRTRRGTIWWPLACSQQIVLAGAAQGPLTGLIAQLQALPNGQRPDILIHDPNGRLRELHDSLGSFPAHADALAQARQTQLAEQFARERGRPFPVRPPLLVVVAPTAAIWPDLQPLLAPTSGVQVVLVPGDRAAGQAVRSACHRLPVVEVPDPRYPLLPDACRPAGLPSVGIGGAIAWLPGDRGHWCGLPVPVQPLRQVDLPAEHT